MANTYQHHHHHLLLPVLTSLFFATAAVVVDAQISKKVQCHEGPLDVIFLVDTNARNATDFERQQNKIADIVRHLERISNARDTLYSVVAFHRRPVILLSIASPFASSTKKVLEHLNSLRARSKFDSSPAKALDLAAQQFINSGRTSSNRLVVLAHDGVSTDLIAETLEARNSLVRLGTAIFAITSTDRPHLPALTGYTMDRTHVFATPSDRDVFFEEMERSIGACTHFVESSTGNNNNNNSNSNNKSMRTFGVMTREVESAQQSEKSSFEDECKANKIDLMVVLDTSGSVFNAFAEERKLARELIESLNPSIFADGRLQICVVRFSSSAEVKIPFKIGQNRDEILEKLDEIKFTGGNTPIARAVDLGLAELSRSRRRDAIQVFVLITDGNGQEPWHVVQMAGKKLQSADAEVFAVSTSRDYNLDELTLYTGDEKRVYVGSRHFQFIPTIAPLMNKCVWGAAGPPQQNETSLSSSSNSSSTGTTSGTTSRQKVLEIDSTASTEPMLGTAGLTSIVIMEKLGPDGTTFSGPIGTVAGDASRSPTVEPESTATSKPATPEKEGTASAGIEKASSTADAGRSATSKKPATEVAPANVDVNPDLAELADSFEELDSSDDTQGSHERMVVAKGIPSSVRGADGTATKLALANDLKTELTVNRPVHEGRATINKRVQDGQTIAQILEQQPPRRSSPDGNLDLLFAIDRSPELPADFTNQLQLARELVDELTDEDVNEERVRVAIISFAHDARLDLEWHNATTKAQIFQRLSSIEYTADGSSPVAGIRLATQYAQMARRPGTRLMIILVSDGNSQDVWHSVTETAMKLHRLPDAIIYAVTTSKQYKFLELEAFAGDKWRVYVDGRTRRFVADAGKQLTEGVNGTGVETSDDVSTAVTISTTAITGSPSETDRNGTPLI